MSEFAEAKRHFYADAVAYGIRDLGDLARAYPHGCSVPEKYLQRWLRNFHSHDSAKSRIAQRLVNRFKLGADPEFVFVDRSGNRVDASALSLKTGQAYGADNNGRLVEVRPRAARSALKMTASVVEELRWLALLHPETRPLAWSCGAYLFRDGLGGHVHLGRKRPQRKVEVAALDNLVEMSLTLGVYPKDQNDARRRGDHFGQQYGKPGDIRMQVHGYEYRVFPSWLDSPWTTFFQVTLAKLAVFDPDLFRVIRGQSPNVLRQRLVNVLAYFKGRDDDAWLAYEAFTKHGIPLYRGGDFKPRWGLEYSLDLSKPSVDIVPGAIAASDTTVQELYDHLLEGKPLVPRVPEPTWKTTKLPAGYYMPVDRMETAHVYGMGEMLFDIAAHVSSKVTFGPIEGDELFRVGTRLARLLPRDWIDQVHKIIPGARCMVSGDGERDIRVGLSWRQAGQVALTRKALLCGAFPLWRVWTVQPESIKDWNPQKAMAIAATTSPRDSKILMERVY